MRRGMLVAAVLVASAAVLGCSQRPSTPPPPPRAAASSESTGPLAPGEKRTVGPYIVELVTTRRVTDPRSRRGLPAAPPVRKGSVGLIVRVSVTNASSREETALPALDAFRLVDRSGRELGLFATGSFRSKPAPPSSPHGSGVGSYFNTPLQPSESFYLEPQFVVPASSKGLLLRYAPLPKRQDIVLEFSLE